MIIITNSCNIILDLVLVLWLNMGIPGIALATVIAEYFGLLVGLILLSKQLQFYPGIWSWQQINNRLAFKKLLFLNQNIFIRNLCLLFAFSFFTVQSAKFGELILAANSILLHFQMFMAYALDGFAHAAEALIGKAVGSRDRKLFRQTITTASYWSVAVALIFTLIYGIFGRSIIDLLTDIETVRASAYLYLPWIIAAPIISVWCYVLDGIFIGATLSREMRNTMLFSMLCCFLPAWYGFRWLDNHGLWLALSIFLAARGVSMVLVFRKTSIKSLKLSI
jgi:MATE family multidrug resistance protein